MKINSIFYIPKKEQNGQRLDKVITKLSKIYSREKIKHFILHGLVKVNNIIISNPDKKVYCNDKIELNINLSNNSIITPKNIRLNIIYEDHNILIINKQSNFAMYSSDEKYNTVLNAILYHCPLNINLPRVGIIHRLDKNTTGILIIAKNLFTQYKLTQLMKNKQIIKEYLAIVHGHTNKYGSIIKPISRNTYDRTCMKVCNFGKLAITHYKVIKYFKNYTYLRVILETGRTHQIRVHMSYIKHPILGDVKYNVIFRNKENDINFNRQALHSYKLKFNYPFNNSKKIWYAPLPKDMKILLKKLS
ncbi:MAG: RluA family pseudouridine synthase, partial [Candidatus Lightella neohaematopini]|nr:RluA family pseudouridine synthase [Candidatus Lightella neohaematopini]